MGLAEDIKELKELVEKKDKKEKKFKFPFSSRVNYPKAKKNWITVMNINENGQVNFTRKKIDEQTIMEEGIPRLASSQYVMYYKKNPLIVLPSWSVEPFSPAERYQKSLRDGSNAAGYKILLNKMLNETTSTKKPMGNALKWIIGLGLAAIIGYAFISGGAG